MFECGFAWLEPQTRFTSPRRGEVHIGAATERNLIMPGWVERSETHHHRR
jgi:hypothetical protein